MEKQGRLSGQTLGGKYVLGKLLGVGGFGIVYLGHNLSLDRPQAIKVLLEQYSREPKSRERFRREAQIVAALHHPHILHIDDFEMDEQKAEAYLVMPFIGGGTFSEILKGQQFPVEQVVLYLEQVCSALDYAHQRGVVHLDLKPSNLLIDGGGGLLLSDFGLAHLLKKEAIEGGTSLWFGSPHYMAPEHINGQPNKSSDVYALGVMLFEMLAGQRPFTGVTPDAIRVKHLTEPVPLLRSLRPDLPIELEEILERALAKQAEERFRSAGALLKAFKGALAHVQEQKLKAEMEERRKAEEERARKAEEEQLRREEQEQALRAEIERLQRADEERTHKAEEERLHRAEREQALRTEIEHLQRVEEEQAHKAEEERLRRAKEEQALRAQIEHLQRTEEERARQAEIERLQKAEEERARQAEEERQHRVKEEKEPISRGEPSRSPHSTHPPLSGEASARPDPSSFALPKRLESPQSRFDEPHTVTPNESRSPRSKRSERSSRSNQIRAFRVDAPPAIHPLPINQIEESDLLIEDYKQAQDVLQAASSYQPIVQKPEDTRRAITSSGNVNKPIPDILAKQSDRLITQVSREDTSQPPSTLGQSISSKLPNTPTATGAGITEEKTAQAQPNDEQTISISPDDDLTTVREHLEQIPSRKITLVIPSQTQLRSHVAWKLLSAHARELNKEVLIVSSDPQVRSFAHAVKLKVAYSAGSRPASQPTQRREGPAHPKSAMAAGTRRPGTMDRLHRLKRLHLILLVQVAGALTILLTILYLNTTSTVTLTVATQNYVHPVTLTLSDKNEPGIVPAKPVSHNFTKTGTEPATGSTLQGTDNATGIAYFTNTGTTTVHIPSLTTIATTKNVNFVTTANVLILPQSANPVPVPIKASYQGIPGNVPARSITVIPPDSLTSIAQAQNPPVTAESLKATLTVSNPEATTGGEAHQVTAVTQQDLDKAKNDLHQQVQADIDAWVQQQRQTGLFGQISTIDTLIKPPTVDTPVPDKAFSVSINVTAIILVAQLNEAREIIASQLNNAVHEDQKFGPTFAIIGDPNIDLTQQNAGEGNTVTVTATSKVGPNLDTTDVQKSIKGKPINEVEGILRRKNPDIKNVDTQTQPDIFHWVSPWIDHITVFILPASK